MTMEMDALFSGRRMPTSFDPCTSCAEWIALKADNDKLRSDLERAIKALASAREHMGTAALNNSLRFDDATTNLPTSAEPIELALSRLSTEPAAAYERGYMDGHAKGLADECNRWLQPVVAALVWMADAWSYIDREWGPSGKTLDQECADGDAPEIAELRQLLTPNVRIEPTSRREEGKA